MRFYVEGTVDASLTEMLALRGLVEGVQVLRVCGEIENSEMIERGEVSLKNYVELGIAATPEVTQAEIDAFMARTDVQDKLRQMLRLKWAVELEMCQALNIDWVQSIDHTAMEHVMLLNKEEKPG